MSVVVFLFKIDSIWTSSYLVKDTYSKILEVVFGCQSQSRETGWYQWWQWRSETQHIPGDQQHSLTIVELKQRNILIHKYFWYKQNHTQQQKLILDLSSWLTGVEQDVAFSWCSTSASKFSKRIWASWDAFLLTSGLKCFYFSYRIFPFILLWPLKKLLCFKISGGSDILKPTWN